MNKLFFLTLCLLFTNAEVCFGCCWKRDHQGDPNDKKTFQQKFNAPQHTMGEEEQFSTKKPLAVSLQLDEAFKNKLPFYALTVTRTTDSPDNYHPMFPEENYFLVSVLLGHFFGSSIDAQEFDHHAGKCLESEEGKYKRFKQEISEHVEKGLSDQSAYENWRIKYINDEISNSLTKIKFKGTAVYQSEEINAIQKLISEGQTGDAFQRLKAGGIKNQNVINQQENLSKILSENFENKYAKYIKQAVEKEIFSSSGHYFFKQMEEKDHQKKLTEYFFERLSNIKNAYNKFSMWKNDYGKNSWGKLKNNLTFIILNEMLFSKTIPLDDDYIKDVFVHVCEFTQSNQKSFLTVNFLKEKKKIFKSKEQYDDFIDKELSVVSKTKLEDLHPPFFENAETEINDYSKYKNKIQNPKIEQNSSVVISCIKNKSYNFWNGVSVTTYKKTSYQNEANKQLKDGNAVYQFGIGEDKSLREKESEKAQTLFMKSSSEEHLHLSDTMKKYVKSGTCYDLNCGSSKIKDVTSQLLYIFTSNTIEVNQSDNKKNLPDTPLILHADPNTEGRLFGHNLRNTISEQKKEEHHLEENNVWPSLRIELTDQKFTFKIFDLKAAMNEIYTDK